MAGKYAGLSAQDIDLEAAQRAVAAAIKKAEELGCKMNIAVVETLNKSSWSPPVPQTSSVGPSSSSRPRCGSTAC